MSAVIKYRRVKVEKPEVGVQCRALVQGRRGSVYIRGIIAEAFLFSVVVIDSKGKRHLGDRQNVVACWRYEPA